MALIEQFALDLERVDKGVWRTWRAGMRFKLRSQRSEKYQRLKAELFAKFAKATDLDPNSPDAKRAQRRAIAIAVARGLVEEWDSSTIERLNPETGEPEPWEFSPTAIESLLLRPEMEPLIDWILGQTAIDEAYDNSAAPLTDTELHELGKEPAGGSLGDGSIS